MNITSIGACALGFGLAVPIAAWSAESTTGVDSGGLQEIVVTAEKRTSTVQNTPISLTAVTGDQLAAQGIATVEQIAATTPGISMRTAGPGQTEFEMRGLASSGGSAPTVGFYLDETPLSPAAASLNGKVVIDPDLYDLDRVEVLRGPQGTLYGSGSMGGTIRLITNAPKFGKFEGSASLEGSGTDGGGFNRGGNLMLNLPLGDTVALRIVGTDKYTSGWIDRIVASPFPFPSGTCAGWAGAGCLRGDVTAAPVNKVVKGVNDERLKGARAALLWRPSSGFTATTTAMYQRITAGGYNQYQDPPGGTGKRAIYQPFDIAEPISDTFKLLSETLTYDWDFAQLTSATSFWKRSQVQAQDSTESLENLFVIGAYLPVTYTEDDESQQFSQELRLTSNSGGPWQWVTGLFFSNLHSSWVDTNQDPAYAALTPASVGGAASNPRGVIYDSNNPYHLKQYAAFGDLSYRFSPELRLTTGLRYYKYDTQLDYFQTGLGTAAGTDLPTSGTVTTSASGVNPKATLSYTPTGDFTLYGTIAKGFRPGGASLPVPTSPSGLTVCPSVPETYGPDSVWNFEVGEKAKLMDSRLIINADVYYIKWEQIQQIITLSCGYPYTTNLGNARSYGPELELSARLTSTLTLNLSGTWTSSTIVSPQAGSGYASGDRVLNIPKETGSVSLAYTHRMLAMYDWVTRVTDSYVGSLVDASYYRQELRGYNLIELRTGLLGDVWSAYLFGTNLTNKHAALTINNTALAWTTPSINRVTTNQPRTVGVEVRFKF